MEFNWGLVIYTIIGIIVFSVPATIKFTKWLKQRKESKARG